MNETNYLKHLSDLNKWWDIDSSTVAGDNRNSDPLITPSDNIVRAFSVIRVEEPIEEPIDTATITTFTSRTTGTGRTSSLFVFESLGTVGLVPFVTEQNIDQTIATSFSSIQTLKSVDDWIVLMKYANAIRNIYPWINKSETLLFPSITSTTMNTEYAAAKFNQLHLHLLRAYARAYDGDFQSSELLLDQIANEWIAEADEYRQPYFLRHLYTTSLCSKKWDIAATYLEQLWLLVKFMDQNKRHAYGIWDEWTCCLIVTWFFMKYWKDFDNVFRKNYLLQSDPFKNQRKTTILKHLSPNFLTDVIEQSFYNKARELNSNLPVIEYKEKPNANL